MKRRLILGKVPSSQVEAAKKKKRSRRKRRRRKRRRKRRRSYHAAFLCGVGWVQAY